MSTVAKIEEAIGQLPPEQWAEIRRWMDSHGRQHRDTAQGRELPFVAATGRAITQQEIDEALDAD